MMRVPLTAVYQTLQAYLGSVYVNDFSGLGRTYRIVLQADAEFRMQPEDIGRLKVRSEAGRMVPLAALLTVTPGTGPDRVMHYNGFLSADLSGGPAPGHSTGQAVAAVERIMEESLPAPRSVDRIAWECLTLVSELTRG